jgi:hypothetical protein
MCAGSRSSVAEREANERAGYAARIVGIAALAAADSIAVTEDEIAASASTSRVSGQGVGGGGIDAICGSDVSRDRLLLSVDDGWKSRPTSLRNKVNVWAAIKSRVVLRGNLSPPSDVCGNSKP